MVKRTAWAAVRRNTKTGKEAIYASELSSDEYSVREIVRRRLPEDPLFEATDPVVRYVRVRITEIEGSAKEP